MYASSGVKAGSGPLTTASNWRQIKRLDKLGGFSFTCQTTDPQFAQIIAKREVQAIDAGQVVGSGIIDDIENDGQGNVTVSGMDIGQELTWRIIGNMDLRTPGWTTAIGVSTVHIDPGTGTGSGASLCSASFDGSTATYYSSGGTTGLDLTDNDRWLYMGGAVPFTQLRLWSAIAASGYGGGSWANGNPAGPSAQFFDGSDWLGFSMVSDTTIAGTNSFAQNGTITFSTGGTAMAQTTEHGVSAYFIRGRFNAAADRVLLYEAQTYGLIPSGTALAQIATGFPAGWSLDTTKGLAATEGTAVYGLLYQEKVFQALLKLSEWTGEHFYIDSDRHVVWIGATGNASGIRAIAPSVPSDSPGTAICYITDITYRSVSYDTITRVYPSGAGIGDGKLTIEHATDSPGAGYVASSDANGYYVRLDPEPSPQIDGVALFKDIGPPTADRPAREQSANQLLRASTAHLGRHSTARVSYDLSVVNLTGTINPGDTIRVDYRAFTGGVSTFNVNADLIVLETTTEYRAGQAVVTGLVVSTVAEWERDAAEVLSKRLEQVEAMATHPQPVGFSDVHTGDFAVNGAGVTTGGGGFAYGASDAASGSGAASGGMAAHEITGAYHTATGLTATHFLGAEGTASFAWRAIAVADLPGSIVYNARTITAGAGLTGGGNLSADRTFAVGAGAGLTVNADDVALTTPGTITATSLNSSTGNHTHAITNTAVGVVSTIMATNASGGYTFGDGGTVGWSDVGFSRGAAGTIHLTADDAYQSADFAIDSDGFRLTGIGEGFFRYLYASEFHAKSFIADLEQALAGGQMITKSVAPLAAAYTLPAAGTTSNFTVQEFQGFGGFRVFVNGDMVRFRNFARTGTSLDISDAWGTVSYVSRDATAQTQTWAFTRSAAAGGLSGYLAPELMTNGNFETLGGGGADKFGTWQEVASDGAITTEPNIVHGGSWSAFLTSGASVDTRMANDTTVTASTLYRYSFWTRGDGVAAGRYSVYDVTNAAYIRTLITTGVTGTTWTQVTYSFTTPVGCTSVRLYLYAGPTNGDDAYFDDASLVQVGAGGAVIPKGALVLDYGVSGNGYIESVAQSGQMALGVPYISMRTWTTHPQTTLTERVHMGNMNGAFGVSGDYFGIGLGDYNAGTGNFLRYDSNGGFLLKAGAGAVTINADGMALEGTSETYASTTALSLKSGTTVFGALHGADSGGYSLAILRAQPVAARNSRVLVYSEMVSGYAASIYLRATGPDPSSSAIVEIKHTGTADTVEVLTADFFVGDGKKVGLEGVGGNTYIVRNGAAIEFWIDGVLCGHVNAATGFVND